MDHGPHTVNDVMTRTVVAVARGAPFKEIVKTLEQWKVSAMPVVEDENRVVGVVSEADLLAKEEHHGRESSGPEQPRRLDGSAKAAAVVAGELMTAPAVTIHPTATLAQAARVMARRHVKRLPVVDADGRLKGIVSRSDLLKVFLRADEDIAQEVRRDIVARLFPLSRNTVEVSVEEGVVTLTGRVQDTSLVPVTVRLVRAVEGVVNVTCDITAASLGRSRPPPVEPGL